MFPFWCCQISEYPFSVVCDAFDFARGSASLQTDPACHERVIAFESCQLKSAEQNYPVHDKKLLAMKYALVKFKVHRLGFKPLAIRRLHGSCVNSHGDTVASPLSDNGTVAFLLCGI